MRPTRTGSELRLFFTLGGRAVPVPTEARGGGGRDLGVGGVGVVVRHPQKVQKSLKNT